jgi:hypothetical protein
MELFPRGGTKGRRVLGTVIIVNDGTGTIKRGNYVWRIASSNGRTLRSGTLTNYPREAYHPTVLLKRVLDKAYPPTRRK